MELKKLLVFALPLILLSCVGPYVGPIKEQNFAQNLQNLSSLNEEPFLLICRTEWGDKTTTCGKYMVGILVLQETKFSVLGWDKENNNYKTKREVAYSDITDVKHHVFMAFQELEVNTKAGKTFLALTTSNGCAINGSKTNKAKFIIRDKIPLKKE